MEKLWTIKPVDEEKLASLRSTGFPDIFLRILINRGMDDVVSIENYFSPKGRFLFSPFLMDGVSVALDRIYKAFAKEESIRIYGDRDVDGITSTVLLLETLRSVHKYVDFTVPVIEDGYGLNPDYIDVAARDGIKLIITVDCGISNLQEVEYARSKGIDVIITDHHEPPPNLPDAIAIVDPKLHDSCCPQKNIAGVGVSFKLSMALEMSRANRLSKPLIAFDLSGNDFSAIRFSPREGFTKLRNIDRASLLGCVPVFFSEKERRRIGEIVPEVISMAPSDPALRPVFVDRFIAECIPDSIGISKDDFKKEVNLMGTEPGKALVLVYLKCLEARLPTVKTLWQRCLDILTIGTVADMVPLQGENRIFAQMGLKFVGKSKRIGLSSLFSILGWKNKKVTERDISFSIAPILNSSGRLRTAELAIELLSTSNAAHAQNLARQLFELNTERKKLGEECYLGVKKFLEEQNDLVNDRIFLVAAPMKNQGVTGIVATRLMLDYCRPVIVLLEDQGKMLGSARSFKNINIIEALSYCQEYLEKFGGHVGAAGLTMPMGNEELFRIKLREFANANISKQDLQPEWLIDSPLAVDEVDEQFLEDLLKFAPFGIDNPAPVFLAEGTSFQEIRKVGDTRNHLRFKFKKRNGRCVFGIGFNLGEIMAPEVIRDGTCDLIFHVEPNDYNGVRSAQLMILDCRIRGFK